MCYTELYKFYLMKLSIIIISNNRINDLRRCLKSVYNQNFLDFEVIVLNDGSKVPGYSDLQNKFKKNFIYLENNYKLGSSVSRNLAVQKSNSNYILFLDDDSQLLEKNTLEKSIDIIENDPTIGQLGGVQQNNKGKINTFASITGWDGFLDRNKSSLNFRDVVSLSMSL